MTHPTLTAVTDRIVQRSRDTRARYLEKIEAAIAKGPARAHLSCGNQAHAYAAMGHDKETLAGGLAPNIGIITAYNDMLSAHKSFETFPSQIKSSARDLGATAQVAGGVPAMCDGVTQGQPGMELSLFSRDVIALSAGVGLSHNTFDAAVYLGVCDKIVPGLVIAAGTFGHLPSVFAAAGPMPSGIPNDEKAAVRKKFAQGEVDRDELMAAEMASYHAAGTCTFYGTANSNQMLMEIMGLQLPGSSFVNPDTDMRTALTDHAVRQVLSRTAGQDFMPVGRILSEKAFVNGMVGLMATGGSTNLILHLPAMARAAGVLIDLEDFAQLSDVVPLLAKVYPNGLADVNHFHAAGGLGYLTGQLLDAGLLHEDVDTILGHGLRANTQDPKLTKGRITYVPGPTKSLNEKILRPVTDPFHAKGGVSRLTGDLGTGVMKVSAVAEDRHIIEAPARVFHTQQAVKDAFQKGELNQDVVVVVRFQGPAANGMPELHNLTPFLTVCQDRGHKIALVTDGRMSGASGKVPSAIHVAPEAANGGPLAYVRDGDVIRVDAKAGVLDNLTAGWSDREPVVYKPNDQNIGLGREMFEMFRNIVGPATAGAATIA